MTEKRTLITAKEIRAARGSLSIPASAIVTPSARDLAESLGVQIVVLADEEPPGPSEKVQSAQETLIELSSRIDHTNLAPEATADDIFRLCDEAVEYGFASVCIHPIRVPGAVKRLDGHAVAVCGVVGFPTGGHDTAIKAQEAALCVEHGAREIDMVANPGLLRDDNITAYHADIAGVRSAIGSETTLKVIIEAPLLAPEEIVRASVIAVNAGADYVKTSTGVYAKAREEDVVLLRRALPEKTKIKAAGGIRTAARACKFLELGADRLGTSSSVEIVNELKRSK